jgi:hypothetical protein
VKETTYSIETIPPFRRLVVDGMDLAARKHNIHGLVEVDITEARERIRQISEKTGERLSFTGFIVYCCARAVDEDKHLHAYRDWRNQLILFDDVDVSFGAEIRGTANRWSCRGLYGRQIASQYRRSTAKSASYSPKASPKRGGAGGFVGTCWFLVSSAGLSFGWPKDSRRP